MTSLARALCVAAVLLGFSCPAARAAEDAAEEEPERERDLAFSVGWDHGITYEYRQRLRVLDSLGAPGWIDDVSVKGRIGASLYLDGGWLGGDVSDDGFQGKVRRARIYTSGKFSYWAKTAYKVEFSVEDSDFVLNDFYLRWRPGRVVDSLRFGYFDPPASLQNVVTSSSRVLMEVAPPVAAFVPGFRLGVDAARAYERPSLSWFLNLSTVGQQANVGNASDEPLRLFGRLVWRPLGKPRTGEPLLHLGVSATLSPATGSSVRYRARPETYLADYAVDTGDVDADSAGTVGLEVAWQDGPRVLQAEFLSSRVDATPGGESFLYGIYAQANWALTGEVRGYDTAQATFRRLVPRNPLSLRGGGLGALELAARLSWLDLSDGTVRGGEMLSLSIGPAWTWNRYVRVLAGYVFARVSDRPDSGILHIVQTRLELAF